MSILKSFIVVVCVLASCAGPLRAANSIFVTVDGLNCFNSDARHPQAFNAVSFSFGATAPPDTGSIGGGGTTPRPTGGDVMVMKNFDVCTPGLLKDLARGTHLRDVTIDWQTMTTSLVIMRIKLEEATVSAVNYGAAQEGVSFSWQKMTLTYWTIRPDGSLGGSVSVTWDRVAGTVS